MPGFIFYPPPMPQGSSPPIIKFPIPTPPPAPDTPPLLTDVYTYTIVQTWQPIQFSKEFLKVRKVPIIPPVQVNDSPPVARQNSIDRINISWYIPPTPYVAYSGQAPVAHLIPPVDNPPNKLSIYPRTIYLQHVESLQWNITKHRPIRDTFITPGITPAPPSATFQVNVNIYSARHVISIEVNNNREIQSVNQGSTFIFTIKAFHRKGFPRVVSQVDAVSIALKDPLGNVVVSNGITQKDKDTFAYTFQLDANAPKGPWSVQAIASFSTDVRITPFATCFTVI